jgi:hypothetical protein
MNQSELNGWILIAGALINMGRDAVSSIKSLLVSEGRTEAEINAALLAIQEDSNTRRAVSAAIAFGASE